MSRILIVEGDQDQREILSRYLRFVGAEVESASTGPEGVSVADQYRPEMILLDIGLPLMSGLDVLEAMRRIDGLGGAHYVAITGMNLTEEQLRAARFCGYLAKPIAPFHIMAQVEHCLGSFHHRC